MLSNVTFASFLAYAPRGTSELSKRAQQFVRALKEERPIGRPPQIPSDYAAHRLANEVPTTVLAEFFDETIIFVPVPRSTLTVEGGLWPASNIASALVNEGIGSRVLPCLERVKPIPKSAFAASGSRPKLIDHYESMLAKKMVVGKEVLCLVDDVITKGATMLAAASRLQETYSDARVIAFALVRTTGFVEDIERMIDPVVGTISLRSGEAHREP